MPRALHTILKLIIAARHRYIMQGLGEHCTVVFYCFTIARRILGTFSLHTMFHLQNNLHVQWTIGARLSTVPIAASLSGYPCLLAGVCPLQCYCLSRKLPKMRQNTLSEFLTSTWLGLLATELPQKSSCFIGLAKQVDLVL